MLDAGANVQATDALGNSAAHHHHDFGVESLKLLIKAGVSINAQNHAGETPLMTMLDVVNYTPMGGYFVDTEKLEFLLNAGADPYLQANDGRNAFDRAQQLYLEVRPEEKEDSEFPDQKFWNDARRTVLKTLKVKRTAPIPQLFEPAIREKPSPVEVRVRLALSLSRAQQERWQVNLPSFSESGQSGEDPCIVASIRRKRFGWRWRHSHDDCLLFLRLDGQRWVGESEFEPGEWVVRFGAHCLDRKRRDFICRPSKGGVQEIVIDLC